MSSNESPQDAQAAEDLLAALKEIAENAGEEILTIYAAAEKGEGPVVREKADSTPVTEADESAEALILEALAELTPDIPVVSEEAASAGYLPDVSGGRFWLVDPLDGTREFLSRNGEFTVNIALVEDGLPVAGVVHAPALGKTWTGAQAKAGTGQAGAARFTETGKEETPVRVRDLPAEGVTVVASRRHGSGDLLDDFLKDYTVKDLVSAGSSLKFCLVASGRADLYPRFGRTMEWDTAAGHAVLLAAGGTVETTAGGTVETVAGQPLAYGKPGFENPFFIARGAKDAASG